jgi:hypothetical protein
VLKLLKLAYGDEGANWVGKRAHLYGDPEVKMKGVKVGGIRVSHLSHIDKPLTASLTVTRGQTGDFVIMPLVESPNAARIAELKAEWATADPDRRAEIESEAKSLEVQP